MVYKKYFFRHAAISVKRAKVTTKQTIQHQAQAAMQSIMQLLYWSNHQYTTFQYESGLAYLRLYLHHDSYGIAHLERSKVFWNWWKNHWVLRDKKFLQLANNPPLGDGGGANIEWLISQYTNLHNAIALAESIYPEGFILNETYAAMMQQFIDDTMQAV